MHSFIHAEGRFGSAELLAWMSACQDVRTAVAALESAGADLIPIIDASNWQSDGLRALHALLMRLRDDTGRELGRLSIREWELKGAVIG